VKEVITNASYTVILRPACSRIIPLFFSYCSLDLNRVKERPFLQCFLIFLVVCLIGPLVPARTDVVGSLGVKLFPFPKTRHKERKGNFDTLIRVWTWRTKESRASNQVWNPSRHFPPDRPKTTGF